MTVSHVYDTYAKTANGQIVHFDVIIDEKNQEKAMGHAKQWLENIGLENASVEQNSCTFCHSTEALPELRRQIDSRGYGIVKLEGCPT